MTALPGPAPAVWNQLALAARNVFATHTWAQCWWDEYGEGATPLVLTDTDRTDSTDSTDGATGADPRVVLALHRQGRLLRQVRWIGHGPADLLGPACAPEDLPRATALLGSALRDGRLRGDVLLLQDMALDQPWSRALTPVQVGSEPSPVVDLRGHATWEGYLASRSRNFRSQVGRKTRALERDHDVELRLATAETLEADLADLFALHVRRWEGETPLGDVRQQRFTGAFAAAALEQGWLRLRTLHLDGRCVAAYLGFRFGDDEYYYQAGRDPDAADGSVGLVLLAHALREAVESGAQELRLLRGDEGYKDRFATGSADIATLARPLSLRGRAATRAAVRRRGAEGDQAQG